MTKTRISTTLRVLWDSAGMVLIFILLFVGLSLWVPHFFTPVNMVGVALSVSTVGMVACAMLFCLASGDFDLSVEAVLIFAGIIAAVVINRTGSVAYGVAAGVLAGGVIGLINGGVIARLRINALIATLASMQIVRGLGYIVAGGQAVGISEERFLLLGTAAIWGVPLPVWLTGLCFVLFGLLLHRTSYGRYTLAIGGNREAARLAGVAVTRIRVTIFAVQGLVTGLAGVILASRMASGQPTASVGFSLDVISACVLGGVSLSGGVGTIWGMVVGVLIMGTVQNAINLMNVPTFYQYIVRGSILLLAVLFDQLKQKRV